MRRWPFTPMGPCHFLADGIENYQTRHGGLLPAVVVIHPSHMEELADDADGPLRPLAVMGGVC